VQKLQPQQAAQQNKECKNEEIFKEKNCCENKEEEGIPR
jgi:hypothetical protein